MFLSNYAPRKTPFGITNPETLLFLRNGPITSYIRNTSESLSTAVTNIDIQMQLKLCQYVDSQLIEQSDEWTLHCMIPGSR